ncbi:MAG: hypothetical protein Ct9H300mP31_20480 [Acidimicrobiaceae bacterium]|nr:MAG: hypothetical protein Ct9H300mP31_20480 [Acidimicrobiaceae bacterium]
MTTRSATRERSTNETSISVSINLDGGPVSASTGIPFFDHMLDQLGATVASVSTCTALGT